MAQPGSPEWVLEHLLTRLDAERPDLDKYDDYYWGRHPLPHIPPDLHKRYLVQFQELLRQANANFMQLVIDAMANRVRVQGFRLSASQDDEADQFASLVWHANQMHTGHRLAIRDTFVKGRGALSVWFPPEGSEFPRVAVEDAKQTIVDTDPETGKRRAALKVWVDDWTGEDRANVYLPDGIYKFKRNHPDETETQVVPALVPANGKRQSEWEPLTDEFVANPTGVVPIIPLIARPDSMGIGHSELEGVIDIQERINGGLFNRVLAGWFAAFRQKWATGVEIPEDDQGNAVEPWEQAIHRMFYDTNPDAKFGTFDATDLTQYLKAHEQDVKDIASITFTPRHFLIQQGQEPSGDALNAADAPLISKVYDREDYLDAGLKETLRLIRLFAGNSTPTPDASIEWADPRDPSVIEASRTDSVIKQYQAGLISREMAQQKLGYDPDEIARMKDDLQSEALRERGIELTEQALSGTGTGSVAAPG